MKKVWFILIKNYLKFHPSLHYCTDKRQKRITLRFKIALVIQSLYAINYFYFQTYN